MCSRISVSVLNPPSSLPPACSSLRMFCGSGLPLESVRLSMPTSRMSIAPSAGFSPASTRPSSWVVRLFVRSFRFFHAMPVTSRITAESMLTKILPPVDAPLRAGGLRGAGLGRGRGAGVALALAGVVRTVGRSATGRGRGADDVARAGSRRGGSLRFSRFGVSRRGGSERFTGSRRGGSARLGCCLRGGSELRGGTWGRRGCPAAGRGVAEGRLGVPFGSPGRGGRLSTPTPLTTSGYPK